MFAQLDANICAYCNRAFDGFAHALPTLSRLDDTVLPWLTQANEESRGLGLFVVLISYKHSP